MATVLSYELEPLVEKEIRHGLKTIDLLVQFWQGGYPVPGSVQIVDEDTIVVRDITVPTRLVLVGSNIIAVKDSNAEAEVKPKPRTRSRASSKPGSTKARKERPSSGS